MPTNNKLPLQRFAVSLTHIAASPQYSLKIPAQAFTQLWRVRSILLQAAQKPEFRESGSSL
jgi:hypothetical protein